MPVILLPIQILLVNLVTDGLPAIALGLEPAEPNIMNRKPRKKDDGIFSDGLLTKIVFRGIFIGLTTLAVFVTLFRSSGDVTTARTGAYFTLVVTQFINVFECKSEQGWLLSIHPFSNWKHFGRCRNFPDGFIDLHLFSTFTIHPKYGIIVLPRNIDGMQFLPDSIDYFLDFAQQAQTGMIKMEGREALCAKKGNIFRNFKERGRSNRHLAA